MKTTIWQPNFVVHVSISVGPICDLPGPTPETSWLAESYTTPWDMIVAESTTEHQVLLGKVEVEAYRLVFTKRGGDGFV